MPKMNVVKSINVKCTIEEAYKTLMDFKQWLPWSPWLILEKDVKLEFKEEDRYYKWTGKLVGSGEMTIEATEPNKAIYYNLTFLKPWKSKSKVSFKLRPSGSDETTITWTMDGSLPFFMFWMKKMMQNYIGMDYERGLRMLKNYLEDGKVHSELEDKGVNRIDGTHYIGIQKHCSMTEMDQVMGGDMERLMTFITENELELTGAPFSIYHKWDIAKQQASFTSAFPVNVIPENLPADFIGGERPTLQTYSMEHTGYYEHLGNAWSGLYMRQRSKVFKSDKKNDPFEVYLNDPQMTDAKELKTVVHFPVKL